jgi:hypothetical protein
VFACPFEYILKYEFVDFAQVAEIKIAAYRPLNEPPQPQSCICRFNLFQ